MVGGLGADERDDSGSDRYDESRLAVHRGNMLKTMRASFKAGSAPTYLLCLFLCRSFSVLAFLPQTTRPAAERFRQQKPRTHPGRPGRCCF